MENAVLLFFEKEVSERCEQARQVGMETGRQAGMETGRQAGMEAGRQAGIYDTIYKNFQAKYGRDSVSSKLRAKIDDINYYPALEEVQLAVWTTPSIVAFERKLSEIVNEYKEEILDTRR